ncbi:MAG: hypothetical protein HYS41_01765 [Candidatus Omnitrophica bacterium]|nr:hypothetical protein [Candidatus Omnitrophota bacterium]
MIPLLLQKLSRAFSAVLFAALYTLLWVPVGLASRFFADWLRLKRPAASQWRAREGRLNLPQHLTDLF